VHPDDLSPTQEQLRAFIDNPSLGYEVEFRLRHRDGSYRWIFTKAQLFGDSSGKPVRMLGCHVDITERKRAEAEIRASAEQLRTFATRLQTVREEERTAIAREIHDVLAQELTRLKIDLVWLAQRVSQPIAEAMQPKIRERVDDAVSQTDVAISTVQRIATELRPLILDSLGLSAAVEWQTEDFARRTAVKARATVPNRDVSLDRDRATALFRILQESLTNVARHAQAANVDVSLRQETDSVVLAVQDNGRGVTMDELHDPRSIGLVGMRERALAFGGAVTIEALRDGGTLVCARIPSLPPKP
jgi:signal transduction histidine kinase